jgi:hypothetical protein
VIRKDPPNLLTILDPNRDHHFLKLKYLRLAANQPFVLIGEKLNSNLEHEVILGGLLITRSEKK